MGAQTTPWELRRESLLAPEVEGEVPELGSAAFACDVIRALISQARARAPQDPAPPQAAMMMMALLGYAYAQGVYGSREISRSCEVRLDFLSIAGGKVPDFKALVAFRDKFVEPLRVLLGQYIEVARRVGVPMADQGGAPHDEAARWLSAGKRRDAEQQAALGGRTGFETPPWMDDPAGRLERIHAALGVHPRSPAPAEGPARARRPSEVVAMEPPCQDPRRPKIRAHSRHTTAIISAVDDLDEAAMVAGPAYDEDDGDATQARGIPAMPEPSPSAPPPAANDGGGRAAAGRASGVTSGAASAVEIIRRVKVPEDRVRLMEVAIGAALVDGELTNLEKRRIEQLVRFLRLAGGDKEHLIGIMRSRRLPEVPTADDVPEYDVRLCIFEHAALMAVADGRPNSEEQGYMREVAEALELELEDVKAVIVSASQQAAT
ncbi:MAG: hypothetical protein CSA66_03615 [Proteobacteria bacterium]|nr:MAG: hypothetical protein CSA66_03615 [Pseudomonadota bacterium]